jgi:signal transduction histidine kinase
LVTYSAVTGTGGELDVGVAVGRDVTAQREAERLREEFVSLVTHELRSPLTASLGNLDLISRLLTRSADAEELDAARVQTLVERVKSTERHLVRLVNNLLDLARVERADLPLELDEVDAGEIVAREVAAVEGQVVAKRLTVAVDMPPTGLVIRTSGLYLGQIVGNLIANAVKYTPPEGRIAIGVAINVLPGPIAQAPSVPMPPPERWLEVRVRDTGYGIGDQDQARLFSRFFRSGREEIRRERGTGLGLALTKQMVDRLGGTISVQSALGVGSTFTVALPSLPVDSTEKAAGSSSNPQVADGETIAPQELPG